jgi:hypothetical protein
MIRHECPGITCRLRFWKKGRETIYEIPPIRERPMGPGLVFCTGAPGVALDGAFWRRRQMIRWQLMSRVILFIIVLALPLSESLARQDVACSAIREEIEAKEAWGHVRDVH